MSILIDLLYCSGIQIHFTVFGHYKYKYQKILDNILDMENNNTLILKIKVKKNSRDCDQKCSSWRRISSERVTNSDIERRKIFYQRAPNSERKFLIWPRATKALAMSLIVPVLKKKKATTYNLFLNELI